MALVPVYLTVTLIALVVIFLTFDGDLYESKFGLDRTEWIIATLGWPVFLPIAVFLGLGWGIARFIKWWWEAFCAT